SGFCLAAEAALPLAGRGYGSVMTAAARKAPASRPFQQIEHRLVAPVHFPEIRHIDRCAQIGQM
ncbi:hypothetical protein, partial [Mesorhizobium sp.]|uniref:hypothetical protein n=1 Tax=Mesorhizobium sp. TaxID=1871066 RepID=UPI00257A6A1E